MTTLSPFATVRAVGELDVGQRPAFATGDDGWSRTVSWVARCTNRRSSWIRAASSGWSSNQANRLCMTRVNAVADVWAPASR